MPRKKKDWSKQKEAWDGFVYILRISTDTGTVFKIGTTNRPPKTRMLEIAGELFRNLPEKLPVEGACPRLWCRAYQPQLNVNKTQNPPTIFR